MAIQMPSRPMQSQGRHWQKRRSEPHPKLPEISGESFNDRPDSVHRLSRVRSEPTVWNRRSQFMDSAAVSARSSASPLTLSRSVLLGTMGFFVASLIVFGTVAFGERWMYRSLGAD